MLVYSLKSFTSLKTLLDSETFWLSFREKKVKILTLNENMQLYITELPVGMNTTAAR